MKRVQVESFVSVVREFLDEVNANDSEFLKGDDSSSLDAIIKSKIIDAANYVNLNADFSMMNPSRYDGYTIPSNDGVITHEIDRNMLRLISAYVSGWSRAVTEFIPSTSNEYASLKNPITSGYPDNPKAGIEYHLRPSATGTSNVSVKFLELYRSGVVGQSVNYYIEYIERAVSGDTHVDVPDTLERAVACYAAGLTLITLKDEHAETFINMANSMIEATHTKCVIHGNNI